MNRSKSGVTLVEAVIALCIIGVAVLPAVTMMTATNRKASFGEHHIFFKTRAARIIEQYSILPYRELVHLADPERIVAQDRVET